MLLTRRPPNSAPRPNTPRPNPARPMSRAAAAWLTAIGIVLIALNLRLSISSTSALLEQLRAQLGFGPLVASMVPALPTLCFAAVGATSAMLARRVGTERAVLLALMVLTVGLAVRAVPRTGALLAGTLLGAAGLALCNVLLPAVVKAHFPARVALLTGVYTTTMALGSAVAAAAAVPVADLLGKPSLGLAAWALPAVLALVVWGLRPGSWRAAAWRADGGTVSAWSAGRTRFGLLVTAFFALQSLNSYAVIGWLPTVLSDHGMSSDRAGFMLGLALIVGVPSTFALMPLTRTAGRLRLAFVAVGVALMAGYLGLLCAPLALPVLWVVLTGFGLGAFPLVLAIIGASGRSAQETAALSTFSQSTGYLLASAGPFGIGLLRSATGGWVLPLVVLLALAALQLLVGLRLTLTRTALEDR
ncbi:MFS transporter [Streptomyces sp. NBC_01591]|uniref:MFS transporter n=1 Tax=Streptomyces sp. NBC_01591 TaxID=2975888 RepID=UPI002DD9D1CD|nr:MFS transporter [Streptomyces sp. NBC_01591]WSD70795.1 MFS transporter [Streptomyces sp. NBC_01591]